jgi:hypothetical protein
MIFVSEIEKGDHLIEKEDHLIICHVGCFRYIPVAVMCMANVDFLQISR